jgi:starvation-inducible DNA-binding protein
MAQIRPTKHDLSESIRKKIIKILNENLVDAMHLSIQGKQAHWNVKGIYFTQFHELFDKFYNESSEWSDLLAERIVQLGGVAEGNLDSIAKRTRLPSYSLELSDGLKHVTALLQSLSFFCKNIRHAIEDSTKIGDIGSADLFTEISRSSDKFLWFLEAHLVENKFLKK